VTGVQTCALPISDNPADNQLRLYLMDGTVITGTLQTPTLPITTAFGDLVVPVRAVIQMRPGLDTHTELDQRIQRLIDDLAAPDAETRDRAQAELTAFGPALMPELQRHAETDDAERRVRIQSIIEALYSAEPDEAGREMPAVSLRRLDTIQTESFTIAGRITIDRFKVRSKFGELTVRLSDIKQAEQLSRAEPEVRRTVQVAGTDMTVRGYKRTPIRVNRGDRIIIKADGKITMTPWGNNSVSSPDGIPQNGMYNGQIPLGALAGRIGKNGDEFLVGQKLNIVAEQSGTLYLGFAMQANWQNYQFPGSYEARIRVVPAK